MTTSQFVVGADCTAQVKSVSDYLLAVCGPLLDEDQRSTLGVEHLGGMFPGEHVFRVTVSRDGTGFLIGRGGATAEAIRTLVRLHSRAIQWRVRLDVRIDPV